MKILALTIASRTHIQMTDSTQSNIPSVEPQWQTLSPLAIVFFILRFSIRFLKDGVLNLAPALAVFITQVENKLYWLSIVGAVFVTFLVVYSVLYYRSFKFIVDKDEIKLHKGVLKKEATTLQFNKVQNVNLSTPFYFAPFKLVNCIFDSAGSSAKEISFPGVSIAYAEQTRTDILSYKASYKASLDESVNAEGDDTSDATVSDESPAMKLPLSEIAKFGLSSNMTFLLLAFMAPFMEHILDFAKLSIVPVMSSTIMSVASNEVDTSTAQAIAIVLLVAGVVVSALLISVLAAIIQFYQYELFINTERFQRVAGLFDRHQITMAKHRIQALSIKQNWVFLLLNRVTIQFHQMAALRQGSAKNKANLSIPTLHPKQCPNILADAFASLAADNVEFTRISRRFISRNFIYACLIPASIMFGLLMLQHFNFVYGLFVVPVGLVFVYLRWRRYGFWFNGEYAAIRSGLIGNKITVFPIYKVQKAKLKTSPAMRRSDLATVELQMAFGNQTIPYLPRKLAQEFVDLVIYEVETNEKHWLQS